MKNQFTLFKNLVKMLPLEKQIIEIDEKIIEVRNEEPMKHLTNHTFRVIKELKYMNQIALNSLNNHYQISSYKNNDNNNLIFFN